MWALADRRKKKVQTQEALPKKALPMPPLLMSRAAKLELLCWSYIWHPSPTALRTSLVKNYHFQFWPKLVHVAGGVWSRVKVITLVTAHGRVRYLICLYSCQEDVGPQSKFIKAFKLAVGFTRLRFRCLLLDLRLFSGFAIPNSKWMNEWMTRIKLARKLLTTPTKKPNLDLMWQKTESIRVMVFSYLAYKLNLQAFYAHIKQHIHYFPWDSSTKLFWQLHANGFHSASREILCLLQSHYTKALQISIA